jgi:hypothetical protein
MASIKLQEFIHDHRDELIGRCRAKVAERTSPPPTDAEISHGVPLFLDQLIAELGSGPSNGVLIQTGAGSHGQELLRQGFTLGQVVHDYGDICQSVTDLSVELAAPISSNDFRTLNRCLDDAIASAVTGFAREEEVSREGQSGELRVLLNTAITAFEVLQTGSVGIAGTTGTLVYRSLLSMRSLMDAPPPRPGRQGNQDR